MAPEQPVELGQLLGGFAAQNGFVAAQAHRVLAGSARRVHQRHMPQPQPVGCKGCRRAGKPRLEFCRPGRAALRQPVPQHRQHTGDEKQAAVFYQRQKTQAGQRRQGRLLRGVPVRQHHRQGTRAQSRQQRIHPQVSQRNVAAHENQHGARSRQPAAWALFVAQAPQCPGPGQHQQPLAEHHHAVGKAHRAAHIVDPAGGGGRVAHKLHRRVGGVGQLGLGDHGFGHDGPMGKVVMPRHKAAPGEHQQPGAQHREGRPPQAQPGGKRLPPAHKHPDQGRKAAQRQRPAHRGKNVQQPGPAHGTANGRNGHQRRLLHRQRKAPGRPQAPPRQAQGKQAQPGQQKQCMHGSLLPQPCRPRACRSISSTTMS